MDATSLLTLLEAAGAVVEAVSQDPGTGAQQPNSDQNDSADDDDDDALKQVEEERQKTKQRLMYQVEGWLGMPSSEDKEERSAMSTTTISTAEECSPMPRPVYHAWRRLLMQAWQPQLSSSTAATMSALQQQQQQQYVNLLMESTLPPEELTLESVWDALRVTHWLQVWMELPLDASVTTGTTGAAEAGNENDKSSVMLDYHWVLLLHEEEDEGSNNNKHNENSRPSSSSSSSSTTPRHLIQALYHHVQQLPVLQAHMHAYTHALQQQHSQQQHPHRLGSGRSTITTTTAASSHGSSTPQSQSQPQQPPPHESRLAALRRSQTVAARFMTEWKAHMQRLQQILSLWYRASSPLLRAYTRTCLGRVWTQYLVRTTTTASISSTTNAIVTRHENTQAASLTLTLPTLHKLLQGRRRQRRRTDDASSLAVYRQVLFQYLVPLHQPDALVLWRDQTPLLSLYHEPLTQCIATILLWGTPSCASSASSMATNRSTVDDDDDDDNENSIVMRQIANEWFPELMQALIQPDIFPVAGNTNKQVLLLHELDTFLGLFAPALKNKNKINKDGNKKEQQRHSTTMIPEWLQEPELPSCPCLWVTEFCRVAARCMASDHSGLAERALQLVRNAVFVELVKCHAPACLPIFLQALVPHQKQQSGGLCSSISTTLSWNPTVRKMTYLALRKFQDTIVDSRVWEVAAQQAFATTTTPSAAGSALPTTMTTSTSTATKTKAKKKTQQQVLPPSARTAGGPPLPRKPTSVGKSRAAPGSGGILGTSWKPPPGRPGGRGGGGGGGMPPPPPRLPSSSMGTGHSGNPASTQQPPLTITGVAPWAMGNHNMGGKPSFSWRSNQQQHSLNNSGGGALSSSSSLHQKGPNASARTETAQQEVAGGPALLSLSELSEEDGEGVIVEEDEEGESANEEMDEGDDEDQKKRENETAEDGVSTAQQQSSASPSSGDSTAYQRVLDYMEMIKPPPEEDEAGASSWSKAQMAETPTLLPNLKFHDLVFGNDLGTGSFGTVRYARLIERNKTRSKWPEYAVKIVSMEKIRSLGYQASIKREIAVLHLLSHPGIARLISSFRFREGTVYLVLEYASRGDLYTLLRQQGSLDHDATRFVVGELVAALASIHDMGLVYGDLKPENIVITEVGHVKLTDFGGCRPVTVEAKKRIHSLARTCLRNLRNGDWKDESSMAEENGDNKGKRDGDEDESKRDQSTSKSRNNEQDENGGEIEEEDEEDDVRVEGTTTYLPPEVVLGAYPTQAADSWALGCVLYQCLSGRPPLLDVDDEATRQRIVTFASDADPSSPLATNDNDEVSKLFEDRHSSGISTEARDLIRTTFQREAGCRPDMYEIARHKFFTSANVQVFSLHQQAASPLEVGNVAPPTGADAEDAQWARRQYSSIWAPQPPQYNLQMDESNQQHQHKSALAALAASPIPEGDEATAFFSAKQQRVEGNGAANNAENAQLLAAPSFSTGSLGKISERRQFLPSPG
ncbi:hypothetical protein ACA910_001130 [Epithemia clementina (nom. ined.)]